MSLYKKDKYFKVIVISLIIILFSMITYDSILWGRMYQDLSVFLVKYGSRGEDVRTVQTKLKQWGYYNGSVDGIYGYKTSEAVKFFQRKNGLKVDGIVGDETAKALGINVAATTSSKSSTKRQDELYTLAQCINGEARGEPYIGQVAVAAVILNRVDDPRFPNSIAGVIFQPGAFTAVADGQMYMAPNESAKKAASDALNGWDPSGGAIYYYNPAKTTNKWIWSRPVIKVIGKHYFCK